MNSERTVLRISIVGKQRAYLLFTHGLKGKSYTNSFKNHQLFHKEHF